jgi:pimeloyl-ACP methyl ester carboxylesterase
MGNETVLSRFDDLSIWKQGGTDREFSANFDRQASATNSVLFLGLSPTKANKTVSLFVSFHRGATQCGILFLISWKWSSNRERNRVVSILHGTTGSGANFLRPEFAGELFGKDQPLDATRYFLVLPDGIGHGGSSKPSDGRRARFPRYGYRDMIEAQYRLVTEGLKVDHL